MGATGSEDRGIRVDSIANDPSALQDKASSESKQTLFIDDEDTRVDEFFSKDDVRAILLQNQEQPGCVQVVPKSTDNSANGKPSRTIMTNELDGTVLVVAQPDESVILLGNIVVRCFRRRP